MTKIPALIPVGPRDFALVDPEDLEMLLEWRWCIGGGKYAGTAKKPVVLMHRMILKNELKDGEYVDHINGNGLDNRRCNLRPCTQSQNCANSNLQKQQVAVVPTAKRNRITSSRFRGVYFRKDKQRWSSYIGTGKTRDNLGCFATEEEAAVKYNEAAAVRYKEFAKLNIV